MQHTPPLPPTYTSPPMQVGDIRNKLYKDDFAIALVSKLLYDCLKMNKGERES